jgi:hypothetical protein
LEKNFIDRENYIDRRKRIIKAGRQEWGKEGKRGKQ